MQLPVNLHTVQIYLSLYISYSVTCMCEESWLDYEQTLKKGISFYCSVQPACGIQIAFYSAHTRRIFPGDKAAGTETARLHLSSAEVKNEWRYASFPSHVLLVGTRQVCFCLICTCSCGKRSHFTPSIRFGPISMAPRSVSISTSR